MSDRLKEDFLIHLSDQDLEWHSLGIHLGVSRRILQNIRDCRYVSPTVAIQSMLRAWFRAFDYDQDSGPIPKLTAALEKVGRQDIIEELRLNSGCRRCNEKVIVHLSDRICFNWEELGIHLGVSNDMIEMYREQLKPLPTKRKPALELLMCWNKCYSGRDRIKDLKSALKQVERNDVVWLINEEMASPTDVYDLPIQSDDQVTSLEQDFEERCTINEEPCCPDQGMLSRGLDEVDGTSAESMTSGKGRSSIGSLSSMDSGIGSLGGTTPTQPDPPTSKPTLIVRPMIRSKEVTGIDQEVKSPVLNNVPATNKVLEKSSPANNITIDRCSPTSHFKDQPTAQ